MDRSSLQYKWDIYLITAWYKTPAYKMTWIVENFITKYNVSDDDLQLLKRFPAKSFMPLNMRAQPFICTNLVKLSNWLWGAEIESVFDIADKLIGSDYDCSTNKTGMIDREDLKEKNKTRKHFKEYQAIKRAVSDNWQHYKASNQWHLCK